MNKNLFLLTLFVCLLNCRCERVESGTSAHDCSLIIKSCQTRCKSEPHHYVRWVVNIDEHDVVCFLESSSGDVPESVSQLTHVVFNVLCCSENFTSSSLPMSKAKSRDFLPLPKPPQGTDETKIDTLIILGVGTLASILLICIFLFGGLMIYHKRKRSKDLEDEVEVKSVPRLERYENNEIILLNAAKCESSPKCNGVCQTQSVSAQTSPHNHSETKRTSFDAVVEEKEKQTLEEPNNYSIADLDYSSQSPLKHHHSSFHSLFNTLNENFSSEKHVGKVEIENDYDIHGTFIPAKSNVYEEDSIYVPYPGFRETNFSTTSDLHSTSNIQVLSVKSKSLECIEDPYVLAPPMKSHRCQHRMEKQDPYQKLVPNGCCILNDNSDDYNMLSHNSSVLSQDAKVLFALNNNLKTSKAENKCNVTIKSHGSDYTSDVTASNW